MAFTSEDQVIAWLRRQPHTRLLGDDAAFLPRGGPWAVSVDSQRADLHFVRDLDPGIVARRLVAVNLSDMAAVGAVPAYGFLTLGAPRDFDRKRFFRAFLSACERYGFTLAGGDIAASALANATLTLLGKKPHGGRWLKRSGARPGDVIWAGGTLGDAAMGCRLVRRGARPRGRGVSLPAGMELPPRLEAAAKRAVRRHLLPVPQLELGLWLGLQRRCAAIDLSDGLALDLGRLCRESHVGCEVVREDLPLARHFQDLAGELRESVWDLVLHGGEDYVLLFALPRAVIPPVRFHCHRIGQVTRTGKLFLRVDAHRRPLDMAGWDHLRAGSTT